MYPNRSLFHDRIHCHASSNTIDATKVAKSSKMNTLSQAPTAVTVSMPQYRPTYSVVLISFLSFIGDVDSGDDNESERHSNESSNRTNNNSQRRLRPTPNVRNNFHNHGQASSPQTVVVTTSASAATSPLSHQQQPYISGRMMSPSYIKPMNSLDLINGVIDVVAAAHAGAASSSATAAASNALNRQMRLRAYGNSKGGMVRHETKL